jgi:hypothetical protein
MMLSRGFLLAVLAVLPMLVGCVIDEPDAVLVTETANLAAPAPEPVDSKAAEELPTPVVSAPPPPPSPPVPALVSLQGQQSVEIMALLGQPHFQRVDAPAELWQYRRNGCVLDLFLYPSSGGGLAVDHLETRQLKPDAEDAQACFATLVRAARGA